MKDAIERRCGWLTSLPRRTATQSVADRTQHLMIGALKGLGFQMLKLFRANVPEMSLERLMEATGWEATKRGWPDFICFKGDKIVCVEVKRKPSVKLKASQRKIMEILIAAGIPCFRWDPRSGFTDLDNRPVHFRHSARLKKFIPRSNEFRASVK